MHFFRAFTIAAGIALPVAQLPAQMPAPTRSGGNLGGANAGGIGSVGSPTGNTPNNNPNSPMGTNTPFPGQRTGSIFLSGKVVLDDGTTLSEPVLIERICNGRARPEGYSDSKGRFSFQLGQDREVFADASEDIPNNPTGRSGGRPNDLMNCDLRASLPGFRSDSVSLATHQYMDNPDVGTIILHRMANVEGFTTTATSALAPKDAKKAYEKGLEDLKKNKPDEAQKEFEKAVGIYSKYAVAWFHLGELDEEHGRVEDARKAYTQSAAADSKYINPYERLYILAFKDEKWQDVADNSDRILHLNPYDFPAAYYANAVANLQLQKLDAAEKSARAAVKLDDAHRNPRAPYVLGLILAQKKNFAESVEYLRAYLNATPNAPDAAVAREQLAQAEKQVQAKAQLPPEN